MRRIWLAGAVVWTAVFITPLDAATTYTYDTLGRLWVVTYDNGYQITYSYDSAGNRTSVVTQSGTSRPSQANNNYIVVLKNGSDSLDPSSNATNPDGGTLTVTSVGSASHGTASIVTGPPPVLYTPNSGYVGNDSFTYTMSDAGGHTSSATVYVTVTNVGPVANSDSVTTPVNQAVTYYPLANDVEPNPPGYTLSISSVGTPSHGSVAINSGTSLTYTPNANYSGNDTFSYMITDGHGLYSTATEAIAVGTPPVAVDDYILTPTSTAINYDPLGNDSDPNGYPLTITSIDSPTAPGHGSAAIVYGNAITYTPYSGYLGTDSFSYTIFDGRLNATATEHVCVGSPLTAVHDDYYLVTGVNYDWIPTYPFNSNPPPDPRSNDSDACGATFLVASVTQPAQGSAILDPGGNTVSYSYGIEVNAGNPHVHTTETFNYTVIDAFGATATATITIHIDVIYGP